jgi:hypothetical protein
MNNELMQQCREEAEAKYGIQYIVARNRWIVVGDPDSTDWMLDEHNAQRKCDALRQVHAAALYVERSKPVAREVEDVCEEVKNAALRRWKEVMSERTEILEAFIAKFGGEPDEVEQVLQSKDNGVLIYSVRRKGAGDYAERSKSQPKCLTVDVAMGIVLKWQEEGMWSCDPYEDEKDLRERLTKAANQ